jgi:hypothetical protein
MSRMTYMRSWKSLRLTSHAWLGLNPQIGRPLSRIVVPLVFLIPLIPDFFPVLKTDCIINQQGYSLLELTVYLL